MKKIKIDVIIILLIIIAAPLAFGLKQYINNKYYNNKKYSINISMTESINNLNDYNFKEHYLSVKRAVDKNEKMAYFASCFVFNRYRNDLLLYRKDLFVDDTLAKVNNEKNDLINWCLSSYRFIDDNTNPKLRSEYYKTVGYNYLYGFKGNQDIDNAKSFFITSNKNFHSNENDRAISVIQKYQNMYPGLKNEYLIIYIDNEIKIK